MFELSPLDRPALEARVVEAWVTQLAEAVGPTDDKARVDLIRALEKLACAAAGLQSQVTADLDGSIRGAEATRGVPEKRRGRGVAAQVALARRTSHHRGRHHVGLARILTREMPFTLQALREGRITEWKATILARETACLSLADRQAVDRRLAGDADTLEKTGDRRLEGTARSLAGELDAASCVLRRRIAESQRRVTLRPAPDTMSRLSAELPVATGVALFKSLSDAADSARAAGDPRTRGQVMTDTLVARVLGTDDGVVPVEVELVVSDEVLFGRRDDSAQLDDFGPIPASSWRWTRAAAASRARWPGSSGCATRPAVRRGATRPSATPTTPIRSSTRGGPAR